jgi:hypothetical protein
MGSNLVVPRRVLRPEWWWRHHPNVVAYVILAIVAFLALAREESLRHSVDRKLAHQTHLVCVAAQANRIEADKRAMAVRRSLIVEVRLLRRFQLGGEAAPLLEIARTQKILPPISCPTPPS